jgi:hypothetical protein
MAMSTKEGQRDDGGKEKSSLGSVSKLASFWFSSASPTEFDPVTVPFPQLLTDACTTDIFKS